MTLTQSLYRECDGVALPVDTRSELNDTLQQGSDVLQSSSPCDAQLLQHTTARLAGGLNVLQHIRQLIGAHKTEAAAAKVTHSNEQSQEEQPSRHQQQETSLQQQQQPSHQQQQLQGQNYQPKISSSAPMHPAAARDLAHAKQHFDELSAKRDEVNKLGNELLLPHQSEMRSQLCRAISVVNQFHNESDASNREKLHQLVNLVTGSRCSVGGVQVAVGDANSPAAMFVREQLCSKLISLAHDKQESSQCVYTSLMLKLWTIDPLLKSLCLFHLYKTCPYLVPFQPSREDFSTEEEYNRALGYRQKDGGALEEMANYLKRMRSASQLFGRLVSMDVEKSGAHMGWQLLSRLLVSPVQSAVTCAVLHGFLSTAGNKMIKLYGKQFHKLMTLIIDQFLPVAQQATEERGEADLAAMKTVLTYYLKSSNIPPPKEGYRPVL